MSEGRMRLLGSFDVTVYENALGTCMTGHWREGPYVKILGPQSEPCVHHLSAAEAREAAAELLKVADDVDAEQARKTEVMP